jgi:hypothetical protein
VTEPPSDTKKTTFSMKRNSYCTANTEGKEISMVNTPFPQTIHTYNISPELKSKLCAISTTRN